MSDTSHYTALSGSRKPFLHLKGSSYGLSFAMETILWYLLMYYPGK